VKPVFALCLTLSLLAGCSDPHLLAGVSIGADGVSVYPALTGSVGGAQVTVSP
jgi:hypothetical protein